MVTALAAAAPAPLAENSTESFDRHATTFLDISTVIDMVGFCMLVGAEPGDVQIARATEHGVETRCTNLDSSVAASASVHGVPLLPGDEPLFIGQLPPAAGSEPGFCSTAWATNRLAVKGTAGPLLNLKAGAGVGAQRRGSAALSRRARIAEVSAVQTVTSGFDLTFSMNRTKLPPAVNAEEGCENSTYVCGGGGPGALVQWKDTWVWPVKCAWFDENALMWTSGSCATLSFDGSKAVKLESTLTAGFTLSLQLPYVNVPVFDFSEIKEYGAAVVLISFGLFIALGVMARRRDQQLDRDLAEVTEQIDQEAANLSRIAKGWHVPVGRMLMSSGAKAEIDGGRSGAWEYLRARSMARADVAGIGSDRHTLARVYRLRRRLRRDARDSNLWTASFRARPGASFNGVRVVSLLSCIIAGSLTSSAFFFRSMADNSVGMDITVYSFFMALLTLQLWIMFVFYSSGTLLRFAPSLRIPSDDWEPPPLADRAPEANEELEAEEEEDTVTDSRWDPGQQGEPFGDMDEEGLAVAQPRRFSAEHASQESPPRPPTDCSEPGGMHCFSPAGTESRPPSRSVGHRFSVCAQSQADSGDHVCTSSQLTEGEPAHADTPGMSPKGSLSRVAAHADVARWSEARGSMAEENDPGVLLGGRRGSLLPPGASAPPPTPDFTSPCSGNPLISLMSYVRSPQTPFPEGHMEDDELFGAFVPCGEAPLGDDSRRPSTASGARRRRRSFHSGRDSPASGAAAPPAAPDLRTASFGTEGGDGPQLLRREVNPDLPGAQLDPMGIMPATFFQQLAGRRKRQGVATRRKSVAVLGLSPAALREEREEEDAEEEEDEKGVVRAAAPLLMARDYGARSLHRRRDAAFAVRSADAREERVVSPEAAGGAELERPRRRFAEDQVRIDSLVADAEMELQKRDAQRRLDASQEASVSNYVVGKELPGGDFACLLDPSDPRSRRSEYRSTNRGGLSFLPTPRSEYKSKTLDGFLQAFGVDSLKSFKAKDPLGQGERLAPQAAVAAAVVVLCKVRCTSLVNLRTKNRADLDRRILEHAAAHLGLCEQDRLEGDAAAWEVLDEVNAGTFCSPAAVELMAPREVRDVMWSELRIGRALTTLGLAAHLALRGEGLPVLEPCSRNAAVQLGNLQRREPVELHPKKITMDSLVDVLCEESSSAEELLRMVDIEETRACWMLGRELVALRRIPAAATIFEVCLGMFNPDLAEVFHPGCSRRGVLGFVADTARDPAVGAVFARHYLMQQITDKEELETRVLGGRWFAKILQQQMSCQTHGERVMLSMALLGLGDVHQPTPQFGGASYSLRVEELRDYTGIVEWKALVQQGRLLEAAHAARRMPKPPPVGRCNTVQYDNVDSVVHEITHHGILVNAFLPGLPYRITPHRFLGHWPFEGLRCVRVVRRWWQRRRPATTPDWRSTIEYCRLLTLVAAERLCGSSTSETVCRMLTDDMLCVGNRVNGGLYSSPEGGMVDPGHRGPVSASGVIEEIGMMDHLPNNNFFTGDVFIPNPELTEYLARRGWAERVRYCIPEGPPLDVTEYKGAAGGVFTRVPLSALGRYLLPQGGTGSPCNPYRGLCIAVNLARLGERLELAAGLYSAVSAAEVYAGARYPLVISPAPGAEVHIHSAKTRAAVTLVHCRHIVLQGVTINGTGAKGWDAFSSPRCVPQDCTFRDCSRAVLLPPDASDHTRDFVLQNNEISAATLSKEAARRCSCRLLPRWAAYAGYALAVLYVLGCSLLTLFITAGYSDAKALEWAVKTLLTLVLDALMVQPFLAMAKTFAAATWRYMALRGATWSASVELDVGILAF